MGILLSTPIIACVDPNKDDCSLMSISTNIGDNMKPTDTPESIKFLDMTFAEMDEKYKDGAESLDYITERCQAKYPGSVGKIGLCCNDSLKGKYDDLMFDADFNKQSGNAMINIGKVENGVYSFCENPGCDPSEPEICIESCRNQGFNKPLDQYEFCRSFVDQMIKENPEGGCPTKCDGTLYYSNTLIIVVLAVLILFMLCLIGSLCYLSLG